MIMLPRDAEVIVQGITGREGAFHSRLMREYGTRVRAGVTPGKGGLRVDGIPVFHSVRAATARFPAVNTSVLFVPAPRCKDAVLEAVESGLGCVVVITEGVPLRDALWMISQARREGSTLIGPNCPGAIIPPSTKLGIMPSRAFSPGYVGVISRSGTLTYEVGDALRRRGLGVSMAVGIGGDPVVGTTLSEAAELLQADPLTEAIIALGEIGGDMEERLASDVKSGALTKPVVSFIAGQTAPPGKRMGHAGAILQSGGSTAREKILALENAGVSNARNPWEIPDILLKKIKKTD
jgi:succinyl-CoA synthetase alpha subunit